MILVIDAALTGQNVCVNDGLITLDFLYSLTDNFNKQAFLI